MNLFKKLLSPKVKQILCAHHWEPVEKHLVESNKADWGGFDGNQSGFSPLYYDNFKIISRCSKCLDEKVYEERHYKD